MPRYSPQDLKEVSSDRGVAHLNEELRRITDVIDGVIGREEQVAAPVQAPVTEQISRMEEAASTPVDLTTGTGTGTTTIINNITNVSVPIVSGVVWLNKMPTSEDPLAECTPSNGFYGYGVYNDIKHNLNLPNPANYNIELIDLHRNIWDTREEGDERPDGLIISSFRQQTAFAYHEPLDKDTIRIYGAYKPEIMLDENKLTTYRGRVVTNLLFRFTIIGNTSTSNITDEPEKFPNMGRYVLIDPDGKPWAISVGIDGAIRTDPYGNPFQANQLLLGSRPHIWVLRVDSDGVLITDYLGDYEGVSIVMIEKDFNGVYWEITVDDIGTLITQEL